MCLNQQIITDSKRKALGRRALEFALYSLFFSSFHQPMTLSFRIAIIHTILLFYFGIEGNTLTV